MSYISDMYHCSFSEDHGILTLEYRMKSNCKLRKISRFSSFACLLALRKTHAINFAFHLYKKVASMQAISLDRSKRKMGSVAFQWKETWSKQLLFVKWPPRCEAACLI